MAVAPKIALAFPKAHSHLRKLHIVIYPEEIDFLLLKY